MLPAGRKIRCLGKIALSVANRTDRLNSGRVCTSLATSLIVKSAGQIVFNCTAQNEIHHAHRGK